MKKILLFLICLTILSFSGCKNSNKTDANNTVSTPVVINLPSDNTVNGYRINKPEKETSSKTDDKSETYIANKKTKVFHKSTCTYAKKIKDENIYKTDDRQKLINEGYKPCKQCKP